MSIVLALDLGSTTGWALRTGDGQITRGTQAFRPGGQEGGGCVTSASSTGSPRPRPPPTASPRCTSRNSADMPASTRRTPKAASRSRSPPGASTTASLPPAYRSARSRSTPLARATPTRLRWWQPCEPMGTTRQTTTKPMPSPCWPGRSRMPSRGARHLQPHLEDLRHDRHLR